MFKFFFRSTGESASFESCLKTARDYVENETKVQRVIDLHNYDINIFSYFYDRAVQANLLGNNNQIEVGDYKQAAKIGIA